METSHWFVFEAEKKNHHFFGVLKAVLLEGGFRILRAEESSRIQNKVDFTWNLYS